MIKLRTGLFAASVLIACGGGALAGDREVIKCRASEGARQMAGLCGAHGCDCGILKSECSSTAKFLSEIGPDGRAYMENKFAYDRACK
jgi:hypothetical protein